MSFSCKVCSSEFEGHPSNANKYCSEECMTKSFSGEWQSSEENIYDTPKGENHHNWRRRTTEECLECKGSFKRKPWLHDADFCSKECFYGYKRVERTESDCRECSASFEHRRDRDRFFCGLECFVDHVDGRRSEEKWETVKCRSCQEEFPAYKNYNRDFCSIECRSVFYSGENSPAWRGGWEKYYGASWNFQRKEKVRKRDNRECRSCGRARDENEDRLHVHHILPFREFGVEDHEEANKMSNLITLCGHCHRKVESGKKECPTNE